VFQGRPWPQMRVVCAKKESALGVRGAIPGSGALGRKGLADLASEKGTWGRVCRLLEVESEGPASGRALTLLRSASRPARRHVGLPRAQIGAGDEHLGAEHSSLHDWPTELDGNPVSETGRGVQDIARRFLEKQHIYRVFTERGGSFERCWHLFW
jgi:hypothetical protein